MPILTWTHHALLPETLAALEQILAMDWDGSQAESIEAGRLHNSAVMSRDMIPEKPKMRRKVERDVTLDAFDAEHIPDRGG